MCFNKIPETLERCGVVLIDETSTSCYEVENHPAIGVYSCQGAPGNKGEKKVKFLVKAWKESDHKLSIYENDADSFFSDRRRLKSFRDREFTSAARLLTEGFLLNFNDSAKRNQDSVTAIVYTRGPRKFSFIKSPKGERFIFF